MGRVLEHHDQASDSTFPAIDSHSIRQYKPACEVTPPHINTFWQEQGEIVQVGICGADHTEDRRSQETLPVTSLLTSKHVQCSARESNKKAHLRAQSVFTNEKSSSSCTTPRSYFRSVPICNSNRLMHSTSRAVQRPVHLLIASLGNPPPYQNTRHSAGHILLKSLQSYLALPKPAKSRVYGGQVSFGKEVGKPQWTLFQSSSYMNTSGVSVVKAYREFLKEQETSSEADAINGLVILYDEMELAPSSLKLRRGPTSAKGHNGIKSVQQSLQSAGLLDGLSKGSRGVGVSIAEQPPDRFIKLAIGIGRPEGKTRDPDDISAYVLGQLTSQELHAIEALAGKVVSMLDDEMARLSFAA